MSPKDILSALPRLNILVIGDLILDHYIWGDVHRISPEAPVPVVHATRDTHTAGGAANVALNLASLGVGSSIIGSIGKDADGITLTSLLENAGIRTTGCIRSGEAPTIIKTRVIVRTQQLCRIDREAHRGHYAIHSDPAFQPLLDESIRNADAVVLSDYAKGVITQDMLDLVTGLARKYGKLVALDPKPSRRLNFTGIGLMTPNRKEALELAEMPEPAQGEPYPLQDICRIIHGKYAPEILVVTLGADGMAVCKNGEIIDVIPTYAREVFDVTGAGDTVIASLTAAISAGAQPLAAARFANLAAGVVVSKIGTAVPHPDEILNSNPAGMSPDGP